MLEKKNIKYYSCIKKLNIDNSQDIEYDEQKMKIIEENIEIFRNFCERKII